MHNQSAGFDQSRSFRSDGITGENEVASFDGLVAGKAGVAHRLVGGRKVSVG
jgi:hypothetical protein